MARINTNVAALNALRNLSKSENEMAKTLERLSSGQKLNRASDGPAALVIAEQMKSQISSIDQAISNSETSVSMLQTAEGALSEVSSILVSLRQLAVHAANMGTNDQNMLLADQSEIDNLLISLERIAETTQFGTRALLDGSNAVSGVAVGEGVEFVSADVKTRPSASEGYKVNVTQVATRSMAVANRALELEEAYANFVITEGGKSVALDVSQQKDLKEQIDKIIQATLRDTTPLDEDEAKQMIQHLIANKLQTIVEDAGLDLEIFVYEPAEELSELLEDANVDEHVLDELKSWPAELKDLVDEKVIVIRHKDYGSEPSFTVTTSAEELFHDDAAPNQAVTAVPGKDVEGTIGGEPEVELGQPAIGKGRLLSAAPGTDAEGLVIRYAPDTDDVLHAIFDRADRSFGGLFIEEKSNEFLVGDEKPGMGLWSDVIPEIEGFVHVTQNSLAFQVGPNEGQQVRVSIHSTRPNDLGMGVKNDSGFGSLGDISVMTSEETQDAIKVIDQAINEVSTMRAHIGSFQKNALESNLNSLGVAKERLTAATSTLTDTNMAEEMSNFVKHQILMSAGTAMLAQANQVPRSVLQLLQGGGA